MANLQEYKKNENNENKNNKSAKKMINDSKSEDTNKTEKTDKKENKKNSIRIFSYNSRGFDMVKQKICQQLLEVKDDAVIPILCNQENFVLKGNTYLIRKAMDRG